MSLSPHERVKRALWHQKPDRVPADLLATPEVWEQLIAHFSPDTFGMVDGDFFSGPREAVLRKLQIDCRVVSYDMFCNPPASALVSGARVDWWNSPSRSTPCRMWRQVLTDGTLRDIWGHRLRLAANTLGRYEEFDGWPLGDCSSVDELKKFPWPDPDWWDFSPLDGLLSQFNSTERPHVRFRAGSIFESSWQLRGMDNFLADLATDPAIPLSIMDRITEVLVELTRRALTAAGDHLDMVYFYDDVGSQESLIISREMWRKFIRPRHERLISVAKSFGKPVMYHSDGAIDPLIPELIDMGIDVLNPIQPNVRNMAPARLKSAFGERLCFHGGIDIVETLPRGSVERVRSEVVDRIKVLGKDGGYILCSSHHLQPDTPLKNILAMYEPSLRST